MSSIFELPQELLTQELFEPLIKSDHILIEPIISIGQTTPTSEEYDQDRNE